MIANRASDAPIHTIWNQKENTSGVLRLKTMATGQTDPDIIVETRGLGTSFGEFLPGTCSLRPGVMPAIFCAVAPKMT